MSGLNTSNAVVAFDKMEQKVREGGGEGLGCGGAQEGDPGLSPA